MTKRDNGESSPRQLYRDTENGWLFGVCAGVADYFGFNVGAVRFLTFLSVIFFMPAAFFMYLCAALLLKRKPRGMYESNAEESFWRSVRRDPRDALHEIRYRFRDFEVRLQRMEKYVTSSRFDLDREFKNLRD